MASIELISSLTNLMKYVSMVANLIVEGGQVDTISTDFIKLLVKWILLGLLLTKLSSFEVTAKMVKYFRVICATGTGLIDG